MIVIDVADLAERQPVEEDRHVGEARDRDPDPADLSLRLGRVGVVAHLGREVERHREARLAVVEQVAEPAVRFLGRREAGVLAHRPEAAAVHRRLDAAGERILAGSAEIAVLVKAGGVGGGVEVARTRSEDVSKRSLRSGAGFQRLRAERLSPAGASGVGCLAGAVDRPVARRSIEDQEEVADLDRLADADGDARDDCIARRAQLVLHLHRLHNEERLARGDGVARDDRDARDHARDDGTDLGRSAVGRPRAASRVLAREAPPGALTRPRPRSASPRR